MYLHTDSALLSFIHYIHHVNGNYYDEATINNLQVSHINFARHYIQPHDMMGYKGSFDSKRRSNGSFFHLLYNYNDEIFLFEKGI